MYSSPASSTSIIHLGANDHVHVKVNRFDTATAGEVFIVCIGDFPVEAQFFLTRDQLTELLGQIESAVRAALDEQQPDAADADRDTSDPFAPVP